MSPGLALRIPLVVIAAGLLGFLTGVLGTSWWLDLRAGRQYGQPTWDPRAHIQTEDGPPPRLVIDETEADLGTIPRDTAVSHTFWLTNAGDGDLRLEEGGTSCECALSHLERPVLRPGETIGVTLSWRGTSLDQEFRHAATLLTNDPDQPAVELRIKGHVTRFVSLHPPVAALGIVPLGETRSLRVQLLSYREPPVELREHRFLDAAGPDPCDVEVTPLAPDDFEDPAAQSGLSILLTTRPDQPPGRIDRRLQLTTNLSDVPFELPIAALVCGDVLIDGLGWHADQRVLSLGSIPQGIGVRRELSIYARATDADVALQVASVSPAELKVTLGEARTFEHDPFVVIPLVIEVPGEMPPGNYGTDADFPAGRISLSSNLPSAARLEMAVEFVVLK